jgi:organic radical activating enzyme
MTSILAAMRRLLTPRKPLPAGTHHYQAPPDAPKPYRLHLRLEPDGSGLLIVNAATVLHLNNTAAEYAYHLVKQTPKYEAAFLISSRYHVSRSRAGKDYDDFVDRIQTLINTPDLDPVAYLDFGRFTPYSQEISAPYRLDCALTYNLPPEASPSLAPTRRVDRELTTEEWKTILDKAWEAGIPHVAFTGGEPTLREDLVELIQYAEAKGQVSGLLTDGLRLVDLGYLDEILKSGLDHIMLNLQADNLNADAAMKNILAADIHLTVHLTLTPENAARTTLLVEHLAEMGIKNISLSAVDPALQPTLQATRDYATTLGLSLVWDLPVPYSSFNPIALEAVDEATAEGAGRAWLYVEPDGDVLPAQGINRVLGNILRDPWDVIWSKAKQPSV